MSRGPHKHIRTTHHQVPADNIDQRTVDDFGREWTRFDQVGASSGELDEIFQQYFSIFPWRLLPKFAEGIDIGCGTGRWAARVAPRVGKLYCVDASPAALAVARRNLVDFDNCEFHISPVNEIPLPNDSMDFAYCLGVLHHLPDPQAGLDACVSKLKPGAPMLIYMYYALDGKPQWFIALWRIANALRSFTSKFPPRAKFFVASLIATLVYLPLARVGRTVRRWGQETKHWPLAYYQDRSYYTMRTDALDRFGTRLEKRFHSDEVLTMMEEAGLTDVRLSPSPPYWCAVGIRKHA